MKGFLLFPFILLSLMNNSFAQNEKKLGGVAIKVSPLNLLEPHFPSIEGAIEIQPTRNWTVQSEVSIKIPLLTTKPDSIFFSNSAGYRLRLEVRRYIILDKTDSKVYFKPYVAASAMYSNNKYTSGRSYALGDTVNHPDGFDVFGVWKRNYGIDARFGVQIVFSHRWIIDGYIGVGVKYRDINNVGREPHYYGDQLFPSGDLEKDSGFIPMVPLGIKVGYIITKNRFR